MPFIVKARPPLREPAHAELPEPLARVVGEIARRGGGQVRPGRLTVAAEFESETACGAALLELLDWAASGGRGLPPPCVGVDVADAGGSSALREQIAAGLCWAARPGQVLASARAIESLSDHRGFMVTPWGAQPLAWTAEAVEIGELQPRDARRGAAVPRTRKTVPNNLPERTTRLIGREALLEETVAALGERTGPVTLVGPAGVGKSALALAVAETLCADVTDGVFWLGPGDLDPAGDPTRELERVLAAVGAVGEGQSLADLEGLLVVDGWDAWGLDVDQTLRVLRSVPRSMALLTSRRPLGVAREAPKRVGPLHGASEPDADEGLQLLLDAARRTDPYWEITPDRVEDARRLCDALDRLPLALELVGGRMVYHSPSELLAEVETGGAGTGADVLRDSIATSVAGLDPAQRRLLEGASMLEGAFTAEGAALALDEDDMAERLADLARRSLLEKREIPGGRTDYRMLAPVRAWLHEALDDAYGRRAEVDSRLLELLTLRCTDERLDQVRVRRLVGVAPTVVRAASLLDERTGDDVLLGVAGGLTDVVAEWVGAYSPEESESVSQGPAARAWTVARALGSLALDRGLGAPTTRAALLRGHGEASRRQGDRDAAEADLEALGALTRGLPDGREKIRCLTDASALATCLRLRDRAVAHSVEAYRLSTRLGGAIEHESALTVHLGNLVMANRYEEAKALCESEMLEAAGSLEAMPPGALVNYASACADGGWLRRAIEVSDVAMARVAAAHDPLLRCYLRANRSVALLWSGAIDEASEEFASSAEAFRSAGHEVMAGTMLAEASVGRALAGSFREAAARLHALREVAREAGDPRGLTSLYWGVGAYVHALLHDRAGAQTRIANARETGGRWLHSRARALIGLAATHLASEGAAGMELREACSEAVAAASGDAGSRPWLAWVEASVALAYARSGAAPDALAHESRARELSAHMDSPVIGMAIDHAAGLRFRSEDATEAAVACLEQALETAASLDLLDPAWRISLELSLALSELGDSEGALELAAYARDLLRAVIEETPPTMLVDHHASLVSALDARLRRA